MFAIPEAEKEARKGFGFRSEGFRALGFRGLGLRVQVLGFRAQGS